MDSSVTMTVLIDWKNKMVLKSVKLLGLITLLLTSSAYANSNAALSGDEMDAGICIIATQGIHTAASERQAGTSQAQTKKKLDGELAKLNHSFKAQSQFINTIKNVWYGALKDIYQLPIAKTKDEKNAFVSDITEQAFVSCLNHLKKSKSGN